MFDLWKELNDFSAYEKHIPCALCKKDSEKTIVGDHWKCSSCDHLFNENGEALSEAVKCYCEVCRPREKEEIKEKVTKKRKKKTRI
jgi:hypothetical protein